jgi:hypothetical protein
MPPTVPIPPATCLRRWGGADFPSLRAHEPNPAVLEIHPDPAGFGTSIKFCGPKLVNSGRRILDEGPAFNSNLQAAYSMEIPSLLLKYLSCAPDFPANARNNPVRLNSASPAG